MLTSAFLLRISGILVPICFTCTAYYYSYPYFQGCAFPLPARRNVTHHERNLKEETWKPLPPVAPFRLLVLADPQLEGDSSLSFFDSQLWDFNVLLDELKEVPKTEIPSYILENLRLAILEDLPKIPGNIRKRIDLFGNDFYLAHIYKTLRRWTDPTHVTVLGDLLGSQWISDDEFERRASRFWNRVFKGGRFGSGQIGVDASEKEKSAIRLQTEILGENLAWKDKIINIVGNHDIGYAGDIDNARIVRFEESFGLVNWKISFRLPEGSYSNRSLRDHHQETDEEIQESPELNLIILNTMNLDVPAYEIEEQKKTYDFINDIIISSPPVGDDRSFTVLLTHIPLFKPSGVCVDGPFIEYFVDSNNGGIREQNHLTDHSSKSILEGIFGLNGSPDAPGAGFGRRGIILNGHDHEGCDVYHFIPPPKDANEPSWQVTRYNNSLSEILETSNTSRNLVDGSPFLHVPGMREITMRSMMGEFGGYGALLSAWWDDEARKWHIDIKRCSAGVQHWWWAVHIIDVLAILLIPFSVLLRVKESRATVPLPKQKKQAKLSKKKAAKYD